MEMSIMLSHPKEKRKMMTKSIEELLEASNQYVDAAMNGSTISDSIKMRVLVKAGIVSTEGKSVTLSKEAQAIVAKLSGIRLKYRLTYSMAVEQTINETSFQ
ncbi:unnamed protein product [Arctia plantaginis]|uniref:Uncharacterized protein n=1 Tax=Arctia plantaginis TaxID=874455 RepID=A0A8S0ZJS9_ARCPL|nr:unnamed protein product [Arctia plantaginis]